MIGRPRQDTCKRGHARTEENLTKGRACKICTDIVRNEWNKLNLTTERKRQYHLSSRYKMTPEEYQEIYDRQNGCCAVCGKKQDVLCIDHDHLTGKVREGLCSNCNRAIGLIDDSFEIALNISEYLKKHKEQDAFNQRSFDPAGESQGHDPCHCAGDGF